MVVTEQEAEKKVCVHLSTPDEIACCMGSMCMSWRWLVSEYHKKKESSVSSEIDVLENRGYCGLASRIN